MMRISETRQRQRALIAEYREQRQHYKKEQEHTQRAREAREVGRFYDKETERTYEFGERIPAADPTACVPCGGKRKAEIAEEITHQHKRLKTNTCEMSPSQETKEHLEGIKVRRQEGQLYQGTARQGEGRRAGQEKPTNPYASLKAAKRERPSKAVVDPPRKAAAKRGGKGIESRQGHSKHEIVAKKTTVPKEATPFRKRKAAEDLEEVSDAASDVAEGATSTIYKKRKVEPEAKVEAVAAAKPVERAAKESSGKRRKVSRALDGDAVQPALYGDDEPSAKKRTQDEPTVETEALEEEVTESSKNVKTEEVFIPLRRTSWSGSHLTIGSVSFKASRPSGEFVYSERPNERGPNFSKSSGWGRASQIIRETVIVKKPPPKGGSSGKRKWG